MKLRVLVAVAVVTVLAVAGVVGWHLLRPRPAYVSAVGSLPASTLRSMFTDWARVDQQVGAPPVGTKLTSADINELLRKGYDHGTIELSAIQDSSDVLNRLYGFTPFDLDWEIYGQSDSGAVDVLRFSDKFDMSHLDDSLRNLGYSEPSSSQGVWTVGPDALSALSLALTPIQGNIVLLQSRHLVLMSDNADYAGQAAKVITSGAPNLLGVDGTQALASMPEAPVSATMWSKDFACADLAMSQADSGDQARANELIAAAGTISPLAGLVMAQQMNGHFTVGMWFADEQQAQQNLASRRALASGDAPGQGGSFPDRFSVGGAAVDGRMVTLDLIPHESRSLMNDIASGPVLFATC